MTNDGVKHFILEMSVFHRRVRARPLPIFITNLHPLASNLDLPVQYLVYCGEVPAHTQLMLDELSDLKGKEHMLQEANRELRRKLQEAGVENALRLSWENGRNGGPNVPSDGQTDQSERFLQPLACDSSLQIGYHPISIDQLNNGVTSQNGDGYAPAWM